MGLFNYYCVTKPETKTTEFLKNVHKEKKKEGCSTKELMNTLIHTYLTHREMGESVFSVFKHNKKKQFS
jgi:hypothetical protein